MANTESIIQYLGLTQRDRIMTVLPFHYCFGTSLLHTHLRVGGSLVIDSRFMYPEKVLQRMHETQCTGLAGVPSHYQILLRRSSIREMNFPNLRYVQQAGGHLAPSFIRELRQHPDTKDIPIVVISLQAHRGEQELNGVGFQVIDWFEKPTDSVALHGLTSQLTYAEGMSERRAAVPLEVGSDPSGLQPRDGRRRIPLVLQRHRNALRQSRERSLRLPGRKAAGRRPCT